MDKAVLTINALDLFKKLENLCLSLEHGSSPNNSPYVEKAWKDARELIDEIKSEDS